MIERKPNRKVGVTSYHHRKNMVERAITSYPSIELLQHDIDNLTIDNSLPLLIDTYGESEFWYVVGSDIILHIGQWQSVNRLFSNMRLCVVLRSNSDREKIEAALQKLQNTYNHLEYKLLPEVWSPVSSSHIRELVKLGKKAPMLDKKTHDYIAENNLYRQ